MPTFSTVTVPVIKAFRHNGREVSVGESVTVSPLNASILARKQLVSLARNYQTRVVTPESESEPPRRRRGRPRKGTYERSDMRAEE